LELLLHGVMNFPHNFAVLHRIASCALQHFLLGMLTGSLRPFKTLIQLE
jgi:nitrate reductase gamma subunit